MGANSYLTTPTPETREEREDQGKTKARKQNKQNQDRGGHPKGGRERRRSKKAEADPAKRY
ncbi:hypothetical protein [Anabaena sp. CCY 9402-a]|uniref:hypothetical protein n=1 Tax=Anabaena sp. CCY 9402-a TaxID=3103867 RepID=UPI0039C6A53A